MIAVGLCISPWWNRAEGLGRVVVWAGPPPWPLSFFSRRSSGSAEEVGVISRASADVWLREAKWATHRADAANAKLSRLVKV